MTSKPTKVERGDPVGFKKATDEEWEAVLEAGRFQRERDMLFEMVSGRRMIEGMSKSDAISTTIKDLSKRYLIHEDVVAALAEHDRQKQAEAT
jgi:hypothetical protein